MDGRRALTLAQAGMRRDVAKLFSGVADDIRGVLMRYAGKDGLIPVRNIGDVLTRTDQIISDMLTGSGSTRGWGGNGVTPQSPFAERLNYWMAYATYAAVKIQERWLKKNAPKDVFDWLAKGTGRVVQESEWHDELPAWAEALNVQRFFEPDPLASIDRSRSWVPPHRWNQPDGYRLSDRLWRVDVTTRTAIDDLIQSRIRNGTSALRLADLVEQYLHPGLERVRTSRPYNRDVSFYAMRLARTEITRVFNSAAGTAARMNPYVTGIDVARSAYGSPTCTICPRHATLGLSGERLRPPYPPMSAVFGPFHPHCMCIVLPVSENPDAVTERLRLALVQAERELLPHNRTPADAIAFTEQLLGREWWESVVTQLIQPRLPGG